MTDFHTHVLPKMDDGSSGTEESLDMLRVAAAQGIAAVVATPHYYAKREAPEKFLERRQASYRRLREVIEAQGAAEPLPELYLGAEVKMFSGIGSLELLSELTVNGTDYILLEMPFEPWSENMFHELNQVRARGLRPIIAHIERYESLQKRTDNIERLMDSDVLIQANAEFFLQRFGSGRAFRMLAGERIHLLGSDSHNMTSRPPNLGEAMGKIEKKLGAEVLSNLKYRSRKVLLG